MEYFTSLSLEKLFNQKWWDYSTVFLNINGRVSLEGLLFFATGCSLVVYLIALTIDDLVEKIPEDKRWSIAKILVILFSVDVISSTFNTNQGEGINAL